MPEETLNPLDQEIIEKGKDVHTESYSMSIGEIKNLYEEGDLDLHPEFQRFFRWSDEQRYKLIESILLGIPLPSFFVHQKQDGVWDIVDGLQRLSTIFEFMGILKDEEEKVIPALRMKGTKYLPTLEGRYWDGPTEESSISETLKRDFKRKKLAFNIILKESDITAKYELFERLNTGGSSATSQEIRNAILIRENNYAFKTLDRMSNYEAFVSSNNLSETLLDERFDLELITRFITLRNFDLQVLSKTTATDYITNELINKAQTENYDWEEEEEIFYKVLTMIHNAIGENAFRKYNVKKEKFEGGFIVSSFEVIALGLAYNLHQIDETTIMDKVIQFWTDKENGVIKWAGRNTTSRLLITLQYGRDLFSN